jgi:hypothetical protein
VSNDIIVVRWFDNSCVNLVSDYAGIKPVDTVQRWSAKDKQRVDTPRPHIVAEYNKHMGGVDLCDMLLALYRLEHKELKYYMRIFHYCLGVAMVNAWLLYKRDFALLPARQTDNERAISLREFLVSVSEALRFAQKDVCTPRGRMVPRRSGKIPLCVKRKRSSKQTHSVSTELRFDSVGHWPEKIIGREQRCKLCATGRTRVRCTKCNVFLCFERVNHFVHFRVPAESLAS